MPLLCSVVCTTYNHANYSRAAIESIAAQDYGNIEVIVVDDGSTDGNVAVLEAALESSGLPYNLIAQENTGNVAMNANRGIAAAQGAICVLTSLDDLFLPDCLSSKLELMQQDPNLVLVGNSLNAEVDGAGIVTGTDVPNAVFDHENADATELLEIEFTHIGTHFVQGTAYRASFLDAIGGFEEGLDGDDLNFRTKAWKALIENPELKHAFLRQSGFAYRKHEGNLHRGTLRQVKTVIAWKKKFFSERPLPDLARQWIISYLNQCIKAKDDVALRHALTLDPEIPEIFETYQKTWRYRRRALKYKIADLFRRSDAA